MKELIQKKLPSLNDFQLLEEIEKVGELVFLQPGEKLIKKGSYPKFIPLILEGIIKVNRVDDNGNEVFLYYLTAGESCSMTLACCANYSASKLSATVEDEEAAIIKIPIAAMDEWMGKYSAWRAFVFNSLNNRIISLLEAIDQIAFSNLDDRLLNLIEKMAISKKSNELKVTHQDLARELNTSREVISRLLKKLEEQKILTLGRNKINLLEIRTNPV